MSRSHFDFYSIRKRRHSPPGNHHSNMFHFTQWRTRERSYMLGPLPAGFVTRSADGHSAHVHNLKFSFFECAHFIRLFEPLQYDAEHATLLINWRASASCRLPFCWPRFFTLPLSVHS